jgi:predicted RNase H-like nuclease (RuvC/YqgF family)
MKSLTLALCVVAILGSAASTFFYFQIGNTKAELTQEVAAAQTRSNELQGRLSETTAQGEVLQKRLAELDTDLGDAKSKTTAAEGRNAQLTRDVALVRSQLTAKTEAEQALNREIAELKREVAQAKLAASAASPEEIENYKTTIATLQSKVAELESNRGTTGGLANTGASGNAGQVAGAAVGTSAKVVSIGEKNAFVVLDIGSSQGVQVGQKINVLRGADTVATASVSSVQDAYSIAQINAGSLRGGLVKGDSAAIAQ